MSNPEQWVNLPSEERFKTDGITTRARLGPVRVRYRMRQAVLSAFRLRLDPDPGDATYTATEQARNRNFRVRIRTAGHNAGTDAGRLLKTVHLNAAGGNLYQIRALYRGRETTSSITVESRRRLFYQVMHMVGMSDHPTTAMEDAFWNPADKFYVKLVRKGGASTQIPQIPTIQFANNDHNTLQATCNAPANCQVTALAPYAFVICFARYITEPQDQTVTLTTTVAVPGRLLRRVAGGFDLTLPAGSHLWYGMDSADDVRGRWLDRVVRCRFTPTGGTAVDIPVNRADLSVLPDMDFTYGGQRRIRLTLDDARLPRGWLSGVNGELRIRLAVRTVGGWTNGFQWNNIIAIANRVVWEDMPAAVREYTLVHEVGHRLGMAASGTPTSGTAPAVAPQAQWQNQRTPDVHDQYYDQSWGGHMGGHCMNGANWDGTNWGGSPGCVMFGADGVATLDATGNVVVTSAPPTFCALCKPQVRKVDLSQ